MTKLTVLTWFWKQEGGRAQYKAEYVNIWADMVRRNLTLPHELACVTAHPEGIDPGIRIIEPPGEFEDISLPTWSHASGKPQCLRRISLFRPDAAEIFGERFVSMDTDCVVLGSLDPLFDTDEDFKMYAGTTRHRPYNGSMLLMTAGARSPVYTEFTAEAAMRAGREYVGSDQAWISYMLGAGEAVWDVTDGVFWYNNPSNQLYDGRIMFFPGYPKPWDLVKEGKTWILDRYKHSSKGKCLILGHGRNVWTDAEQALAANSFGAVIASPETSAYWPGDVLAIAHNDAEAERLAIMHGFDDFVFCGRSET